MYTPEKINELKDNEIFVFGSNLRGAHGAGAAKLAHDKFGAKYGVAEGLTGQSYAFPTLDEELYTVSPFELLKSKFRLYECCKNNPDKAFYLTKIGCGLAGFDEEDIKLIFNDNYPILNLIKPKGW